MNGKVWACFFLVLVQILDTMTKEKGSPARAIASLEGGLFIIAALYFME